MLWLEDEIYRNFRIPCKDVLTGTSLQPELHGLPSGTKQDLLGHLLGPGLTSPTVQLQDEQGLSSPAGNAADIGMLALNATGEMRYLGPSSGAFFAAYASALARSCISTQDLWYRSANSQQGRTGSKMDADPAHIFEQLSSNHIILFLQSYKMWMQPLYPILNSDDLDALVSRYKEGVELDHLICNQEPESSTDLMLFYMVMALGAINDANTVKQMQLQADRGISLDLTTPRPSPMSLCTRALQLLDYNAQRLHPSLEFIQVILLISIYSSYGPIGSSQWQLAGFAMRVVIIRLPTLFRFHLVRDVSFNFCLQC